MSEAWKENTVESVNQLRDSDCVTFINPTGSPRFVFLGNSITRHAPKTEIGWTGDHGMAASCRENDYVHRMMSALQEKHPNAAFCIAQGSSWEGTFWNDSTYARFAAVRAFCPDVLFFRLGDNVRFEALEEHDLAAGVHDYLSYLTDEHTRVIFSTCFWHREPVDVELRRVAQEDGRPLVELGDLGDDRAMKAYGLFEHKGVASHPGDEGMRAIAERLLAAYENDL